MKKLFEDKEYYESVAQKGQKTIATDFSPLATGEMARARLEAIWKNGSGEETEEERLRQEAVFKKLQKALQGKLGSDDEQEQMQKETDENYVADVRTLAPQFFASLDLMDQTRANSAARPVLGNPITTLIKKLFRKMMGWYINPFAEQQTDFNTSSTICTMLAGEEIRLLKLQMLMVRQQLFMSEETITELSQRVQELKQKLPVCEKSAEEEGKAK